PDALPIWGMQPGEVINERLAQPPSRFGHERQSWGWISADDNPPDRFHDVKGRAQYGLVIAIQEDLWRRRVRGMQLRKHAVLSAHIMRRLDLAAEGWAAQHHFPIAEAHQVCQVRMTTGELLNGKGDRKSTRLNSSHGSISYAVFCLKK